MLAAGIEVFPKYPDTTFGRKDRGWFRRLFTWRPDILGVDTEISPPFDWQLEVLDSAKHLLIAIGRQSGKTQVAAAMAVEEGFYSGYPWETVVISKSREQAGLMFSRMRWMVQLNHLLAWGAYRITDTLILLDSGASIYSRPAGHTGDSTRGIRPKKLLIDESAYVADPVFQVVRPATLRTKGQIVLLSTPAGKHGFFHKVFSKKSDKWKKFQIASWDVPGVTKKECMEAADEADMSDIMARQEYGAEFIDEGHSAFTQALIDAMFQDDAPVNSVGEPGVQYSFAMDIGTSVDSTVAFIGHQTPKGHIYVDWAKEWKPPNDLTVIVDQIGPIMEGYNIRWVTLPKLGQGETIQALLDPVYRGKTTLVAESLQMKFDLYINAKYALQRYRVKVPMAYQNSLSRQMQQLIVEPSERYAGKSKIGHPYSNDNLSHRGHKYHDDWYDAWILFLYPYLARKHSHASYTATYKRPRNLYR